MHVFFLYKATVPVHENKGSEDESMLFGNKLVSNAHVMV